MSIYASLLAHFLEFLPLDWTILDLRGWVLEDQPVVLDPLPSTTVSHKILNKAKSVLLKSMNCNSAVCLAHSAQDHKLHSHDCCS